jgi:hypothetical protein
MENQTGPAMGLKDFVRWATTMPQAIAVYFLCVLLVGGASFYAGSLKPKKAVGIGPPPAVSVPRN